MNEHLIFDRFLEAHKSMRRLLHTYSRVRLQCDQDVSITRDYTSLYPTLMKRLLSNIAVEDPNDPFVNSVSDLYD